MSKCVYQGCDQPARKYHECRKHKAGRPKNCYEEAYKPPVPLKEHPAQYEVELPEVLRGLTI